MGLGKTHHEILSIPAPYDHALHQSNLAHDLPSSVQRLQILEFLLRYRPNVPGILLLRHRVRLNESRRDGVFVRPVELLRHDATHVNRVVRHSLHRWVAGSRLPRKLNEYGNRRARYPPSLV